MKTLTIKNLSDDLHHRLRERAQRHRRSLNQEVLAALEQTVRSEPIDAQEFVERIRRHRPERHERFTAEDFGAAEESGRP